jgi:ankyrin repeat protein
MPLINPSMPLKPFYFDDDVWGPDTWPLLSAAWSGDLDAVSRMLEQDPARIGAQFAYYEPLHYAVKGGSLAMVELLLRKGAQPAAPGWSRLGDETPLAKAKYRHREDMALLLEQAAAKAPPYIWPEKKPFTPEQQARHDFVIACGYTPDVGLVHRTIPLHPAWMNRGLYEAIHHDRMDMVHILLEAGADVNGLMPFACWFTPLMHTLRYPQPRWPMAELLLQLGTPVDSVNGLGMTALHIVVAFGIVQAAKWLLDHGADPNVKDWEFEATPLAWAIRWGREDMAALL